MMESKWLIATVGIIALVVGAGLGYALTLPQTMKLKDENDNLKLQLESLNASYSALNATYTWMKQHSFTYYLVGNAINITDLEITTTGEIFPTTYIRGNITNISGKPIETVYVYLILRNPDGSCDFETYRYDEIEHLYIDEREPFEFSLWTYDESQTVEIFLVY